jgi:hypothetical protein
MAVLIVVSTVSILVGGYYVVTSGMVAMDVRLEVFSALSSLNIPTYATKTRIFAGIAVGAAISVIVSAIGIWFVRRMLTVGLVAGTAVLAILEIAENTLLVANRGWDFGGHDWVSGPLMLLWVLILVLSLRFSRS